MKGKTSTWFIVAKSTIKGLEKGLINDKINSHYKNGIVVETSDEAKQIISGELNIPIDKLGIQYGIHIPIK